MKKNEVATLKKEVKKKKFTYEEKLVLKNELGRIKGELKAKEHVDRRKKVMEKFKTQAKESIAKGQ